MVSMPLPSKICRALGLSILPRRGCGSPIWRPPFSCRKHAAPKASVPHGANKNIPYLPPYVRGKQCCGRSVPEDHKSPDSICAAHGMSSECEAELARCMQRTF